MPLDRSTLIPITNMINITKLKDTDIKSDDFKNIFINIAENVNLIINAVNAKDIAIYSSDEVITGQTLFDNDGIDAKPVLRKLIDCGALLDTANKQIAHNLDSTWKYKFTRIYGCSSDSTNKVYIPIPYSSATAIDIVELFIDDTYINITTGKNMTSFDKTYVVIEYIE